MILKEDTSYKRSLVTNGYQFLPKHHSLWENMEHQIVT